MLASRETGRTALPLSTSGRRVRVDALCLLPRGHDVRFALHLHRIFVGKRPALPGNLDGRGDAFITRRILQAVAWDIYWTQDPCMFVMGRLENEKLFGTPALLQARGHAIVRHLVAYLQHRAMFQWTFLADMNRGMWSRDFDDPDDIAFADRPRLTARSLAATRCGASSRVAGATRRSATWSSVFADRPRYT
jgi:hypothetical protein